MQLSEITAKDVQRWLNKLADVPIAANRTKAMLSAMFSEAERQGLRPENSNPCRNVKSYPSRENTRYLTMAEFKRLGIVLDRIEAGKSFHPVVVPAIRFLLLTGARKMEALTMKWEWIDFDRKAAFLPDSKTGPRTVLLSQPAIDVIRSIPRLENNPYVFFGAKEGDHFHNLRKPFIKILDLAKIDSFRIHDLRHTHGAFSVTQGVPLNVIAKILGHRNTRTTERYAHVDNDPALAAAESVGELMRSAAA